MTTDWTGPVNQILYGLTYTQEITEDIVEFFATNAVNRTTLPLGAAAYYRAIGDALASCENLASPLLPQFDHAAIATFLLAVAAQLDALRPWSEPAYRRLDPANWPSFEEFAPIAQLELCVFDVTNALRTQFHPVDAPHPRMYALLLRLDTGETVALVGSYAEGEVVTLLSDSAANAAQTVERFLAATGLPARKISPS